MKKTFVCSRLMNGVYADNLRDAKAYCRYVALERNSIPVAPHAYFTGFLDDSRGEEREIGVSMGLELLKGCDEVMVFDVGVISEGMRREIDAANEAGKRLIYVGRDEIGGILRKYGNGL